MGNAASASAVGRDCLLSAVGNDSARVAFQGDVLYQSTDIQAYNLNLPVVPAAVTFPETSGEVANVVKCAADQGYKVQSKAGGHSYGNYGKQWSLLSHQVSSYNN